MSFFFFFFFFITNKFPNTIQNMFVFFFFYSHGVPIFPVWMAESRCPSVRDSPLCIPLFFVLRRVSPRSAFLSPSQFEQHAHTAFRFFFPVDDHCVHQI